MLSCYFFRQKESELSDNCKESVKITDKNKAMCYNTII